MKQTYTRTQHFPFHPWEISETSFDPEKYKFMEAVLAISNGYFGQRASFEEGVTGVSGMRGTYIAGVFDTFTNATMIKLKGRPTNPSQMVNVPDFLPVTITIDDETVDLSTCSIEQYRRTLQMKRGVLTRTVVCTTPGGKRISLSFVRFFSRVRPNLALCRIEVTPLDHQATVRFCSLIDGGVSNAAIRPVIAVVPIRDEAQAFHGITCQTANTGICIDMLACDVLNGVPTLSKTSAAATASANAVAAVCAAGQSATVEKFVVATTSRDPESAVINPVDVLRTAVADGFAELLDEHEKSWAAVWRTVAIDIRTANDSDELTQGLHYSLFQMIQNASIHDSTVNIGAKGLTGEHYFGTYFWDTEAYMLPLFALTMPAVAKNLVQSRVHYLSGARAKAREMDLAGAAFPFMSDAYGAECATLWQFGLLGIHVTADVAFGIWLYYCTSGDLDFIAQGGIDVMVETSRFWLSRVFYRADTGEYVINRVLGPDEYHQGVDNNYYTNIMAQENLRKTVVLLNTLRTQRPHEYDTIIDRLELTDAEIAQFVCVAHHIRLPHDEVAQINLQDDRFLMLEPYDLKANPPAGAIVQVWSYDRLMRTQLLRQADLVVAHTLVGDRFTTDEMRRDFEFYEPRTTHDSSLSFCSHSITAARLGKLDLAYDYFLRTARLDLDDIHGNAWMGIHTASLAGAWQCVVLGFGGVRWYNGCLSINPQLPKQWEEFSFAVIWHGVRVSVVVNAKVASVLTDGKDVEIEVYGKQVVVRKDMVEIIRNL